MQQQQVPWTTVKKIDNNAESPKKKYVRISSWLQFFVSAGSFFLLSCFFLTSVYMLIYVNVIYWILLLYLNIFDKIYVTVTNFINEAITQIRKVKFISWKDNLQSGIVALVVIFSVSGFLYFLDKICDFIISKLG